jgi:DNA-directed RNA polymerase specialized sigma24 family protein
MRAVVVLRYFDDLSEADTAAALGMSVGSVKSQASRGLERLRTVLQAGTHDNRDSRAGHDGHDTRETKGTGERSLA